MKPCGMSWLEGLRAGVHRNTNVYMAPSNRACIAPRRAIRVSLRISARPLDSCGKGWAVDGLGQGVQRRTFWGPVIKWAVADWDREAKKNVLGGSDKMGSRRFTQTAILIGLTDDIYIYILYLLVHAGHDA